MTTTAERRRFTGSAAPWIRAGLRARSHGALALALPTACAVPGSYVEPDPASEPCAVLTGDASGWRPSSHPFRVMVLAIDGEPLTKPAFANDPSEVRVRTGWRVGRARVHWIDRFGGMDRDGTVSARFDPGRSYVLRVRGRDDVTFRIERVDER